MPRAPYNTSAYRAMRVLLTTEWVACFWLCGRRATVPDHRIPVALGGSDDDLVPACTRCNAQRGARLARQLQKARRHARAELVGGSSRAW